MTGAFAFGAGAARFGCENELSRRRVEKPLVRRGFVTDDGRQLTEAGASLADGLDLDPA